MSDPIELGIQRMLVAMEACAEEFFAFETAVNLAARAGAELSALLVEDEDLRRFAALPMARVLDPGGRSYRPVNVSTMESALRAFSQRTRQAIERGAKQAGVRWTFRVVRGRLSQEVIDTAQAQDLVVVSGGKAALAVAQSQTCSVLRVGVAGHAAHGAVALYGDSPAASRALVTAVRLSSTRLGDPGVSVLLAPGQPDDISQRRQQAAQLLQRLGHQANVHLLRSKDIDELLRLMRQRSAMLVLDPESLQPADLQLLLQQAPFPVLLMRAAKLTGADD